MIAVVVSLMCVYATGFYAANHAGEAAQPSLPPVLVTGERVSGYHTVPRTALTSDPAALPAATTILDSTDIERTPITTYGDALRGLPEVNVNNFGQGSVGYGISLRGFSDAEHGRDVAYFIDGVPLNEVSSVHTPNYADLNLLIPETIERLEIIRGPFSVEYGDSNLGGVVNTITKRSEPMASLNVSGGSFSTGRGLVTYSRTQAIGGWLEPHLAIEGYTTEGYRDNQEFRRLHFFNKYTVPLTGGALSTRVQFYSGNWGAPGYLNLEQLRAGRISPKAAINRTDGGHKDLVNLVFNYGLGELDQAFSAVGFVSHDNFVRFADFGGGQRVQNEDRTTLGITRRKVWTMRRFEMLPVQFLVGTNWRHDIDSVVQRPTVERHPSGPPTVDLGFYQHGLGVFTQIQVKPVFWFKLTGGSRYDRFWYDIDNRLAQSPNSEADFWTPHVGLAIAPVSWLEIFANFGEGFRSPSAVSDLLTTPNLSPQKLRSQEVGIQIQPMARLRFLADFWTTTLNCEIFQPTPELPPQNIGRSRRAGFDLEGRYYVL